jgi:hypothetical protein
MLLQLHLGFADLFRQFALFLFQSIASCGGFGMILENQVFIPFVVMQGRPSCTFQLVGLTSIPHCSGDVSLCRIPLFIGEPDAWVLAHAVPIHLAIETKKFSGVWTKATTTWRHGGPWNPLDSRVELERLHESLVHDREHNKADEENLIEKDASSSTTEIRRWLSQTKSVCLSAFLWTKSPFDDSGDRPEDLAFLAAISEGAKNVGN